MATATKLTVGDLAGSAGLTPQAVRFYEAEGLLPPAARTPAGYRVYGERAVARLSFIRRARQLGLSLAEIREILGLADSGRAPCCRVRQLLANKVGEVDRRIEELQRLRAQLAQFAKKISAMPDQADTSKAVCYLIETVSLAGRPSGARSKGRRR